MASKEASRGSSGLPKDSTSTTTADDTILTPMENSSNKSEAEVPKARAPRRLMASKSARKPKVTAATLVFTAESDSNSDANDSNAAEDSPDTSESDTDDEAEEAKKKSQARKKTHSKKSKPSSKSHKGHSSAKKAKKKKKKGKKKASVPVTSDSDADSSDTAESDENEGDVEAGVTKLAKPVQPDQFVMSRILALQADMVYVYQHMGLQQPSITGAAPGLPGYNPYVGFQNFLHPAGNPYAGMSFPPTSVAQAPPFPASLGLPNVVPPVSGRRPGSSLSARNGIPNPKALHGELLGRAESDSSKKTNSRSPPEFKRVDQIWDSKIHNFRLQDTAEASQDSKYDKYVFHVRRTFDWEGKFRATFVDIKSKLLRECLEDVVGNVKGVSLVDETPKLDPNLLFLYLEDLRIHLTHLKDLDPAGESKKEIKKNKIRLETKIQHLKLLVKYIDTDYAETKEALYPMLESGIITFELLWALWKPKTLAYTSTYGCTSEPRIFKVDMAQVHSSVLTGQFHYIEGKYFEFDGKRFGYGAISEEIPEFQGARKITSLPCYPLKYHKDEQRLRAELIKRGKKFVSLCGVHYKSYQGMAFFKRKKNLVIKFNVSQSRVMVDPNIFRRINPNYHVSPVKPKDHDIISDDGLSEVSEDEVTASSGSEASCRRKRKFAKKVFLDKNGNVCTVKVRKDLLQQEPQSEKLDSLPAKDAKPKLPVVASTQDDASGQGSDQNPVAKTAETTEQTPGGEPDDKEQVDMPSDFNEEEYLLASPVVLGFAFSEKQWLEFTVSGIKDIKWNVNAWDSLVLEEGTKDLVKALVVSRKYHAANTIDDVIQGKGKGLVTVLHGPPGTGKTLTAEGISELLKCPLYMASAGELGTDPRYLEAELQKILDICHTWGAILLLDEADVFLEKRNMHDIHRNALVSIFLRQLEYFQGILFLTTNRVESFDEAFQSRIHIALRYDNLDVKAKRTIFRMFLDRVKDLGKLEVKAFSDDELSRLSKHDLNGREIKNVVGSAQDLAVHKKEPLSMRHILQVLEVHAKFGRDLKGGTGYEDAMRSYF